ncbi:hypothetical protein V8J82_19170 [Gymnodinialimonas sp. 2305UL16-5]|uniref:hypothetical protein n=1 Tax=Gymnodinialimonas mytili TaxID=3126503 RepID=UPI0030A56BE0
MFKFLFGGTKKAPGVTIETDRDRFARLVSELNGMIDGLVHKPRVTLDPATGHILPETPEQFADEALALPAPEETPERADTANGAEPDRADTSTEPKAETPTPPVPTPPVPNPPKPRA